MPTKVALKAVVDSYDLTKTNKGLMAHDDICSEKELLSQEQQELEELEQTQLDTRREASTLTPESPNAFEEISSESRDKFFDANKDAKFKMCNSASEQTIADVLSASNEVKGPQIEQAGNETPQGTTTPVAGLSEPQFW
ncbi:hypothetical protein QYM36_012256 [Artemia franciscana]|uniref:Uncharacterized protein n=1 Tax=Artemia franciscana TaxID=6661 RepID=A0AA88HPS3_ARTSF|nr:hypothetical protein QYM36_012256 [Artemia franciscana]